MEHGSTTAVLHAKFQYDWMTEIDISDSTIHMIFGFRRRFWWISIVLKPAIAYVTEFCFFQHQPFKLPT